MILDTPPRPRQPFMPWEHIDRWLGAKSFFKAGQRFHVSIDCTRHRLTVPPNTMIPPERAARSIELKAQSDQLRSVWRAQITGR
ncbi:hypothetical protein Bxe_B1287 [Paraburkholderia xenovorans LB400]|uniref:Uncharacterized protein n=1 Tax=Paraburkholderia xenovorans (strain LB400) TaxID=266265 RepID=Q13ML7_PARXL|nr:hypothetical protein Bxe_B1287 [Paraburkholderia xenovorans LB400]